MTVWSCERHHVFNKSSTNSTDKINGAASGWPATGARYRGQIVTGIQGGKLSTAKKIQFLQAPIASFVCKLFSVFRQLRSEFWHHWIELLVFFVLCSFHCRGTFFSFSNMHPSITICFNSPIHTFLCRIPSGGFTYCTGLPSCARANLLRTIKISKGTAVFDWFGMAA